LEIVTKRTDGMRGQAFVVFGDIISASNSIRELQNFNFFGKEIVIEYAKKKSDVVAKMDGTYIARDRRKDIILEDKREEVPDKKKKN